MLLKKQLPQLRIVDFDLRLMKKAGIKFLHAGIRQPRPETPLHLQPNRAERDRPSRKTALHPNQVIPSVDIERSRFLPDLQRERLLPKLWRNVGIICREGRQQPLASAAIAIGAGSKASLHRQGQ